MRLAAWAICAWAGIAGSTAAALAQPRMDLARATLEELLDVEVTSAARKSQRAEDVPAAVYIITRQDIRSSGLTTLPEILRLAPGVHVARLNASRWAVTIRGFNNSYSNKLLVLIDGRSVYSRTFSGVFWDMQDVLTDDIDRIEVIRGPGSVSWGANAVNGIINIITRSTTETQGTLVDLGTGVFAQRRAAVRYGGRLNQAHYRVFSQWSGHGDSGPGDPALNPDRWRSLSGGGRADWTSGVHSLLAQGHITANRTRPGAPAITAFAPGPPPSTDGVSEANMINVLGRWTRTGTAGSILQAQAYHTRAERKEAIGQFVERTSDVDVQYESRLGVRQELVLGGGYRDVDIDVDETLTLQMAPHRIGTLNAFVQNEIALRRDLALTLGVKLEYDTLDDWAVLPTARAMWEASDRQRVWAAISRTHRVVSVTDRSLRFNLAVLPGPGLPVVFGYEGNPAYRHEEFLQAEAGHRLRLGASAAFDVTVFTGSYDGLPTLEPLAPEVRSTPLPHVATGLVLTQLRSARVHGVELSAHWHPGPRWQVEGSYGSFRLSNTIDPASLDAGAAGNDGNMPRHQWTARSALALGGGVRSTVLVFHTGRLDTLDVPAHTRLDTTLEFRLGSRLSVLVALQNLLSGRHLEFVEPLTHSFSVPRSAHVDLRWTF
jgi:iron complex outermembrane receptor protein